MRDKRKLFNSLWEMPYGRTTPYHLFDAAKNSLEFIQKLQLQRKIPVHDGCVNSICWNDNGRYLLSGSDDQKLSIIHGYNYSVLAHIATGHRANIFSAKFLPSTGDTNVISCSGDGIIIYSDLERPDTSLNNRFNCHKGTAYEVITVPNDPNTFLSCGEDRTVRWFDVRTKTSCSKEYCKDDILLFCQSPVTALAVNPLAPYQLAVGCADAYVRIFDRRMLCTGVSVWNGLPGLLTCFTVPEFTQSRRITSLSFSRDGQEMLVSYSSDYIYLFDIRDDLNKHPKVLSATGSSYYAENDTGPFFRGRPFMKRLRIRGDWSDTGPNARPEAETRDEASSSRSSIVRTMNDILTRMFTPPEPQPRPESTSLSSSAPTHVPSSPSDEAVREIASDAIERAIEQHINTQASDNPPTPQISPVDKDSTPGPLDNTTQLTGRHSTDLPSTSQASGSGPIVPRTPSDPSTSCDSHKMQDRLDTDSKSEQTKRKISSIEEETESQEGLSDVSDSGGLESIKRELEAKRKDLVEKHNSEPMVNLHYSGQSVHSGTIRMEVASSSTANERQWREQSNVSDDLVQSPPDDHRTGQSGASSSESETEAAVQTIQPNPNPLPYITNVQSIANPSTSSGEVEVEVDDMVIDDIEDADVDIWDDDSDDESRSSTANAIRRRRRSSEISRSASQSACDESKATSDEIRKVEAQMSNSTKSKVKRKFTGHRNARTMIKEATFWGDNFIMSGSDCGHIFIWDRHTADLIMLMEADHHVVNCLQPHPFDPILASSGIDYDIKLWAPSRAEPLFDEEKANEIIKRNEIMLEETKDTITVPASFMFRMFTTLNHFRTGRAYRWSRANREMRESMNRESNRP